ncbi:MAG: alpha/beta hydrolase-fold protein [Candidatus Avelusimicrobium sp.]|uniref:alpha/beta hydrolase-fold protein n=1 Tax=Candidatus Avelusimicrobium sp. TaxID=3048833 RepID=UPI003F008821
MKKHFFAAVLALLAACPLFAQEEEIMIINPGRETFVHFPSAVLGNKHTLTVFLPETFVPLKGRYPLIVLMGAGPKQADEAAAYMERNKAIVAAVNFEEADYAKREKIVRFVSRELLPYLETNYPVLPGAENRVIASRGTGGAVTAAALLQVPGVFGGAAFISPGDAWEKTTLPTTPFRAFVTGSQAELALAQQTLEKAGLAYGPGFVMEYASSSAPWFGALRTDYLFAPAADLAVTRFKADVSGNELKLESADTVSLRVLARLKNGLTVDYVPSSLRISPMFLEWNAARGTLRALAGADAGTVKISPVVDKPSFSVKIKLKK